MALHQLYKAKFYKALYLSFCSDGKNYWEVNTENKRILTSIEYRFSGDKLTLIYSSGAESTLTLTQEDDGSVQIPNKVGDYIWWMIRLNTPESYSIAFVDAFGNLQRLNTTEQDAAANP